MSTTDSTTGTTTDTAPTTPADTPRTSRPLLVIGIVLGTLAAAWGGLHLVDWAMSSTQTTHESYAAVGAVELVADGDVTVVAADGDVEVDAIARGGLTRPTYHVEERGDRLVLTHRCDWWLSWSCSGSLDVTVPADTEVTVRTANGEVQATGLAQDVDLDSSNGDVEAADIDGDVTARSSNGRVVVAGATGEVTATSSNGDVEVSDAGGDATADSSNGDVTVDGAAGAKVTATSDNGTVEVRGAQGNVRAESSNGDVTVYGGDEPVALTIDTSNGSQTIEAPTDPDADRTVRITSSNGDVSYLAR